MNVFILTEICFSVVSLIIFFIADLLLIFIGGYLFSKYQNVLLRKNLNKIKEILSDRTKELQDYKGALAKLINYDPLTGLRNRSSLFELLELEFRRLERVENTYISILIFDIDNFKDINHGYGPKVGDEILRFFGKFLTNNLRKLDIVGRLGEDEFLAILPTTDIDGARIAAEKIRSKISKSILKYEKEPISFTISGGIASIKSKIRFSSTLMDKFVKEAEKKLKLAKEEGGNKIKW